MARTTVAPELDAPGPTGPPSRGLARALLVEARPKQWAKNVFVFAGIFFDGAVTNPHKLLLSIAAFVIFCGVSSAIYLINDLVDIEKDRLHPVKRNRPLASGALAPSVAKVTAAVLLAVEGCHFDDCNLGDADGDPRTLMLAPQAPRQVVGPIPFRNCRFIGCQFLGVGFTGSPEFLASMTQALTSPQTEAGQ